MKMSLLRRHATFMDLSSRMYPRPAAPLLPLWVSHNPRGGLLVSHGDGRRQDNWAVPLCFRFLASAANSVSSVSARPQYSPVVPAGAGCHRKDMLQNSARAQQGQRLLSTDASWFIRKPETASDEFASAVSNVEKAPANEPEKMLAALEKLKKFAEEKDYCDEEYDAKSLLSAVVSALSNGQLHDGVVKESLKVARLLLQNASEKVRIKLYDYINLKPILEEIRQDYAADTEVIELANEILAKLPSTPK